MAEGGGSGGHDDVHVSFGAQAGELLETIELLKGKFEGLTGIFEKVQKAFITVGAVLAGGEAFKEAIEHTEELIDSTRRMMNQTGMAADEALALAEALKKADTSSEAYLNVVTRMMLKLQTNEAMFRAYGVTVRDVNTKALLPQAEIFRNTMTALEGMKVGSDRNAASLALLGRGARETEPFMRAMADDTEKIAEEQKALGLVITDEAIRLKSEYSDALIKVHTVQEALALHISERLMPRLTTLAEGFAHLGPAIVEGVVAALDTFLFTVETIIGLMNTLVGTIATGFGEIAHVISDNFDPSSKPMTALQFFKNSMAVIAAAVSSVKTAIKMLAEELSYEVAHMVTEVMRLVDVFIAFERSALFDAPEKMKAAWEAGSSAIEGLESEHQASMKKIVEDGRAELDAILTKPYEQPEQKTPAKPKSGTGGAIPIDRTTGGQVAVLQAEAAAELALVKEEARQEQGVLEDKYKQHLVTIDEYYNQKNALDLDANQAEIDNLKTQMAGVAMLQRRKGISDMENLKLMAEHTKLEGQLMVLELQRAHIEVNNSIARRAANKAEADSLAQIAIERAKTSGEAGLAAEAQAIKQKQALFEISNDEALKEEARLEEERYDYTVKGLNDRAELINGDRQAQARLDAEREKEYQAHQSRLTDIANRGVLERRKFELDFVNSINGSFTSMLDHALTFKERLSHVIQSGLREIGAAFLHALNQKFVEKLFDYTGAKQAIGKMVDFVFKGLDVILHKFLATEAAKTGATETGAMERVAIETWAALKSVAINAWSAIKTIAMKAWEAAAGVYAALAAIPIIGPVLAPVAAVAATGVVLGFASHIASAERGYWELPSDQMVQMHKREMALPAPEAEGLRDLIKRNQGGSGGGQPIVLQGASAGDFFIAHKRDLAKALTQLNRNFAFVK